MNYDEARQELLKTPWKTEPCGKSDCWCLTIVPKTEILCDEIGEIWVVGAGELSADVAEHIVKVHNNNLKNDVCYQN